MCVSLSGFAVPPIRLPIWLGLHRFRCSSSHACLRKWRKRFVLSQRKPRMLLVVALRLGLFVRRYEVSQRRAFGGDIHVVRLANALSSSRTLGTVALRRRNDRPLKGDSN